MRHMVQTYRETPSPWKWKLSDLSLIFAVSEFRIRRFHLFSNYGDIEKDMFIKADYQIAISGNLLLWMIYPFFFFFAFLLFLKSVPRLKMDVKMNF